MLHLKQYRSTAQGFVDLLNYAALIDDGVVIGKDGSLLAGFIYRGFDPQSLTASEREAVSAHINSAFANLGTGWATWTESFRVPSPGYSDRNLAEYSDAWTALIDEERRARAEQSGAQFETQHALFVQYLPPKIHNARAAKLFVVGDDTAGRETFLHGALKTFNKVLMELEDALRGGIHDIRRMGGTEVETELGEARQDSLVNHLRKMMTGDVEARVNLPPVAAYMDGWIGGCDFYPGSPPKIGDKYIRCVAIDGFPAASKPGILDGLNELAIPYRWSNRMIYLDPHHAAAALDKYRSRWRQKMRGIRDQVFNTGGGKVNQDAVDMAAWTDAAIALANGATVAWCYYSSVVVLMDEDLALLDEHARIVTQLLVRNGFPARIETWNTTEAFIGSLPGHMDANVRRPLIHTGNLADILPMSTAWPGLSSNPNDKFPQPSRPLLHCVTTGSTSFNLNIHVNDVGHFFGAGPTGKGKSTLLNSIAAAFRLVPGNQVFILDRGRSSFALGHAAGAQYFDLGHEDAPGLCPLEFIDTDDDAAWAEDFLGVCYELQAGKPLTLAQKQELHEAIRNLRTSKSARSITAFLSNTTDREIKQALGHYQIKGKFGGMLDAEPASMKLSRFTVFELEQLMDRGDDITIPVVLVLFRMIERTLKGAPTLILVDEAWSALKHPVVRDKIGEYLRTLRRRNASLGLFTQNLSDINDSEIRSLLKENCPTKIFLANPDAKTDPDVYRAFGVSYGAIKTIAEAVPRSEYYYHSPLGERKFSLSIGPIERSFVSANSAEDIGRMRQLIAEHGADWPKAWLRERQVRFEHLQMENGDDA